MNARDLTEALGGRWLGSYGTSRCPAHRDRDPSLSIRDGETAPLLKCHAGCANADIIDALKASPLWDWTPRRWPWSPKLPKRPAGPINLHYGRARDLWLSAEHDPDLAYLRNRAITIPIPKAIRVAQSVIHGPTDTQLPAMIAAIQGADGPMTAVHRTFLTVDLTRKAPVSAAKMALGSIGNGAVRLAPAGPVLGLCEGVEDAFSAMQIFEIPVWAACGARLEAVALPQETREVHLFGDNDGPGREAIARAAASVTEGGRTAVLRFPPEEFKDWNQALQEAA